jgi:hypothetical protein
VSRINHLPLLIMTLASVLWLASAGARDSRAAFPPALEEQTSGSLTGPELYDESINFAPPFSVWQIDPKLGDLFGSHGQSELCWPTSFAHRMAYDKIWRQPPFTRIMLVADPRTDDYTQQVRHFADECRTDPDGGTPLVKAIPCLHRVFNEMGFANHDVLVIGRGGTGPNHRALTIDDIRTYAKQDVGVILTLGIYTYDSVAKKWVYAGGHYINLYGYDYNVNWGQENIILKVANPAVDYSGRDLMHRWDSISMIRIKQRSGVAYPPNVNYVLDGLHLPSLEKRSMLESIVVFSPRPFNH